MGSHDVFNQLYFKATTTRPLTKEANPYAPRVCLFSFKTSQERFELPTHSLGGCCSIHLSYWDTEQYYSAKIRKNKEVAAVFLKISSGKHTSGRLCSLLNVCFGLNLSGQYDVLKRDVAPEPCQRAAVRFVRRCPKPSLSATFARFDKERPDSWPLIKQQYPT